MLGVHNNGYISQLRQRTFIGCEKVEGGHDMEIAMYIEVNDHR